MTIPVGGEVALGNVADRIQIALTVFESGNQACLYYPLNLPPYLSSCMNLRTASPILYPCFRKGHGRAG